MDEIKREKSKVWTPLFFSVILVIGMVVGFNLRDSLRSKRDLGVVLERNDRLEEVIDLINEKYVDTINTNKLYKDAISGILKTLDPHTVYIPAEELQSVNDDLEGSFSGIGIEFSIIRDTIQVTGVIDNGPAGNAGVMVGDQLVKVNDSTVAGNGITSEHIMHMLRGKKHSSVQITLKRPQIAALKQYTVTRDLIPMPSIDASIMIDSITGYIKINKFSANTYNEFGKALKNLKDAGVKQLIIDLRDNPGGYLKAATSIADELLDDDKLIVFTKGVHASRTEFKTGEKGMFESGKLAILIDEGSASASEILAGAMQDWDRAVILGRRSFGKGLVQEQYDLADGSALRLTVAKYYTPAGRCVQRSFAKGKEAYQADYEKRFESGDLTGNENTMPADTQKYYTAHHRTVYGGGGITPDIYVPYDTTKVNAAMSDMLYSQELKTILLNYYLQNKAALAFKTPEALEQGFNGFDGILKSYLTTLPEADRKKVQKELMQKEKLSYFKLQITAMVARYIFKDNGYFSITAHHDDVVNKAIATFSAADYSKLLGIQGN